MAIKDAANLGKEEELHALRDENNRLRDRLSFLLSIIGRLRSAVPDFPIVFQGIVDGICELTGARYGALSLLDARGNGHRTFFHGITQSEEKRMGRPPSQSGLSAWLRQFQGFPETGPHPFSVLESTIRFKDEDLGALCVAGKAKGGEFTPEDADFLSMFADQAAVVLRHDRMQQQMQERLEETQHLGHEMQALHAVTRLAVSSLDVEDVLAHSLPLVLEATGAQAAEIWLLDPATGVLELKEKYGETAEAFFVRDLFNLGEGLPGVTAEKRHPVMAHDLSAESSLTRGQLVEAGFNCLCAFPLVFQDSPLGILCIAGRGPDCVGETHNRLLSRMADALAVAVQNAELFSQEQQARVEAQKAQKALAESEARHEAILDSSSAVIFLKDLQGRYLFVNKRYQELFHVDLEHVKGKTDYDFFPRATADILRANDQKVLESGTQMEWEELVPQDDGLHTYIALKFPLYDSTGAAYAVCGISTDITERKRMEEQLLQERERLRVLVDTSPVGVLVVELADTSPEGVLAAQEGNERMVVLNQEALRMLGMVPRPEEPLGEYEQGMTFRRPDGSEYARLDLPLQRALYRGETVRAEEVILGFSDGRAVTILVNTTPLYSPDGTITAGVAVMQDISQLKEVERMKDDFFSMITHDLKSPLTTIKGLTSSALLEATGSEIALPVEWARTIEAEVDRLTGLVNNLLDMSRLQASAMPLDREECHPIDLVLSSLEAFRRIPGYDSRQVVVEVPEGLPSIFADYDQILRVLTNLLTNAAQYSSPDTDIVVRGRVTGSRKSLEMEVVDQGIGIPEEEHRRIFEKFYRSPHQMGGRRQGSGLGLAICRAIIQAHGGQIDVKSTPGQGSTFVFTLPYGPT